MKNAHTPFENVSALDQRDNSTASAPCPDIAQAVKYIRAAVATLARLAARKGVQQ